MIKILHTADIHIGMENYGRIDPKTGIHSRLLDFHRSLEFCVDIALTEQVDLFLFAGDAYKTATPTPTHQRLFLQSLLRLFEADIPIMMIVGNHDSAVSFGKAHAIEIFGQLPWEGFHVISRPSIHTITTKHGPLNIVGIPWPSRATAALNSTTPYATSDLLAEQISEATSSIIAQLAARLPHDEPAILAGHLTVSSGVFSGSEKRAIYGSDPVFLPSQLARDPFDYVALGHLHRYQNLNQSGYPALVYAGSIDRIDFGERHDTKGCCLVTIQRKGAVTHRFIPTPIRPFFQIDVSLKPNSDQTEQILAQIHATELHNAVVKIVYHVSPEVHDKVNLNVIQEACASAHFLAGIIPIRPTPHARRRVSVHQDMHYTQLLQTYFTAKPELAPHQERLMQKAAELIEAYESSEKS